MKTVAASLLLFATTVLGAAVHKRQDKLFGALGSMAIKPDRVVQAEPELRSNAKRSIARYGPFTLPPLNVCFRV
jgi:hypothetical protein